MDDIAFIGTGRVAQTLSQALTCAGWPVAAVASRNKTSADFLAAHLPGCTAVSMEDAAQHRFVFLTVRDDAIASVCASLPWRAGQSVVHCSGATELTALSSAADSGAQVGGFHPLQIFSDPQSALHHLAGSSVAIEAAPELNARLQRMARVLGLHPFELPPGARALYHASAGYAASLLLPLLHEAVQLWHEFGVDESQALQALLPLAKGTLASIEQRGLAGALSGPLARGDVRVVQQHLDALAAVGDEHVALYKELARRQWPLLAASETKAVSAKAALETLLGKLPE